MFGKQQPLTPGGGTTTRRSTTEPGPVNLTANLGNGTIVVAAEMGRQHADVVIHTQETSGPAADAVREAVVEVSGNSIKVEVDEIVVTNINGRIITQRRRPGTKTDIGGGGIRFGNGNVQVNSFGGVSVGGTVYGNINTGSGGVFINGASVGVGGPQIEVTVYVPADSNVKVKGSLAAVGRFNRLVADVEDGGFDLDGRAVEVAANTMNGSVRIADAEEITAKTMNGSIKVDRVRRRGHLDTMNGSVTVFGDNGARVRATSMNGSVRHGSNLDIDASSMNGKVRPQPPLTYGPDDEPVQDDGPIRVQSTTGDPYRDGAGGRGYGPPQQIDRAAPIALPAGPTPRGDDR